MADEPIGLETNPDLAKRIGFVIGHYTGLEYHLFLIYAALGTHMIDEVTSDHVHECFEKFYALRSINKKAELLLATAEPLVEDVLYRACEKVCKRMKTAAKKRTHVAHDGIMRDGKGNWFRLTSTQQKPAFVPFTDDYFKRIRDQYRTLGRDLGTLLTFVVQIDDRLTNLLRALPLPPGMPFPLEDEAPRAPSSHEIEEARASIVRLQLESLSRPDDP